MAGTGSDDIASAKQQLRRQVLARRDELDEGRRIEASLRLEDRALELIGLVDPGTVVSGFLPIRSEVDIRPLMAALGQMGARLCVPARASFNSANSAPVRRSNPRVSAHMHPARTRRSSTLK